MGSFTPVNIPESIAMGQQAQQNAFAQPFNMQALAQRTALEKQQTAGVALDNQVQQQKLKDSDAFTKTIMHYDPQKNTLDDIPRMFTQNGGSGLGALQAQKDLTTAKTNLLKMSDDQFAQQQKQNDLVQGVHDQVTQAPPEQKQQVYQQGLQQLQAAGVDVSKESPQYPGDQEFAQHLVPIRLHTALIADAGKQREADANAAKAANENAQAALTNIKVNLAKDSKPGDFDSQIDQIFDPKQNAGGNKMAKAMVNGALSRGDFEGAKQVLDQAYQSQQDVQKEIQLNTDPKIMAGKAQQAALDARATQPYKIEQAKVEGQTRQLMQGMTEPVYAYVPQAGGPPQKTLMSKTDALQAGIKTMLPVTEKEVGEDTMLINRLSDVHQKISRYQDAMQKWDMNASDRAAVQRLTQSDKFKLGVWGAEVPVDEFNKAIDQLHIHNLSGPARDALVAYYNAHESMVGYNRVLSGSGKSSDKALELQGATLPDISTADHDMAARGFRDFKENLNVVGQGLPKLPGVKSPEEWEQGTSPRSANPRSFPRSIGGQGYLSNLLGGGQ